MQRLICIMVLFYLIQTYGSNPGIFDLPLTIYLKNSLHLSPAELATFGTLVILPWTIKPLYGIIADVFPIFGYRFKSYFFICYTLALVFLLGLSSIQNHTIQNLAISMVLISTCIAFSDVLTDKIMVVEGSKNNNTASLQAAQWAGLGFGGAILSYLSGWLAKNYNLSFVFLLTAIVPLIGLVATALLLTESRTQPNQVDIRSNIRAIWNAGKSRQFLAILGFIACLQFGVIPPLVYYLMDVLKFDEEFLGMLGAFGSLASGLGAITFGILAPRISRHLLLNLIIGLSAISTLGLLFIYDKQSAILVNLFMGFTGMIASLGVLEIGAKSCPIGVEGTTYALMASVYNLSNRPGPILGGYLYGKGVPLSTLVIISAIFTMLCWFLIPLLRLEQE